MPQQAASLYVTLNADGSLKIGSCAHCVIDQHGRPTRAWDPNGDTELDFDRDQLIAELGARGITVQITEEYVCP